MGDPEFAVSVETTSSERAVVRVHGELDMATTPELEDALAAAPQAQEIVVDLSECTFLDSAGIRVITSIIRTTESVSVVTDDPGIRRILEITGLESLVDVRTALEDTV